MTLTRRIKIRKDFISLIIITAAWSGGLLINMSLAVVVIETGYRGATAAINLRPTVFNSYHQPTLQRLEAENKITWENKS